MQVLFSFSSYHILRTTDTLRSNVFFIVTHGPCQYVLHLPQGQILAHLERSG